MPKIEKMSESRKEDSKDVTTQDEQKLKLNKRSPNIANTKIQ